MKALNDVPHAVQVLTTALKNDPGFYQSYQANIAMAMFDEMESLSFSGDKFDLCNAAAKRFLDMWIGVGNQTINPPKDDWFKEAF